MPKTVLNDRNLYEKRNKDDIFIRDVIGGLLKLLNNRLVYTQVWEDSSEGMEDITVPFYYDLGNSSGERFLQDNYITFGSQCGFKQINGNFDMLPRGVVSLESAQIESDSITNRLVMGEYQREDSVDGKIKTYVSWLYSIPMSLSFNCEIRSSSFTEKLKINQACNEFFYKNKTYYITHKGMKLGCRVGFPENFFGEKNSGYTMGGGDSVEKNNYKQSFELKVECYQPVFDKGTERLKSNVVRSWSSSIENFSTNREIQENSGEILVNSGPVAGNFFYEAPYYFDTVYKVGSEEYENDVLTPLGLEYTNSEITHKVEDNFNMMYLVDDYEGLNLFPSNSVIPFRWTNRNQFGDHTYVKILFEEESDSFKNENFGVKDSSVVVIDMVENHLSYDWNIPKDFTGFDGTDIMLINNDFVTVYKEPIIRIIPDPSTGLVTEKSIFCLDPGYFFCSDVQGVWDKKEKNNDHGGFSYFTHIDAEISYKNKKGGFDRISVVLPIKDNSLETYEVNGLFINLSRVNEKPISFKYESDIPYRKGKLVIQDPARTNRRISIPMTIV